MRDLLKRVFLILLVFVIIFPLGAGYLFLHNKQAMIERIISMGLEYDNIELGDIVFFTKVHEDTEFIGSSARRIQVYTPLVRYFYVYKFPPGSVPASENVGVWGVVNMRGRVQLILAWRLDEPFY